MLLERLQFAMVRRKTGERQKKIQSQRIGKGRGKVNRYDVIVESNDKKPIHIRGMLWYKTFREHCVLQIKEAVI